MNPTQTQEQENIQKIRESVPAVLPHEVLPLSRMIEAVRADSQDRPENYLDESVVPYGGE